MSEKVKASAIYAEAFRLEAEVVSLRAEVQAVRFANAEMGKRMREAEDNAAAAEERGRRAGIEEAAKRADEWYLHESHEPHSPGGSIRNLLTQRGLAPRDSGKDLTAADPADRFAKDRK